MFLKICSECALSIQTDIDILVPMSTYIDSTRHDMLCLFTFESWKRLYLPGAGDVRRGGDGVYTLEKGGAALHVLPHPGNEQSSDGTSTL